METFFLLVMDFFFKKTPTMADFRFLRTHFFLVHPVYITPFLSDHWMAVNVITLLQTVAGFC